jgi:ABC-type bacteriocin/lantibiotic exporter with double-glycine peptidase domain
MSQRQVYAADNHEMEGVQSMPAMLAEIIWNQNTLAVVGVFSVPIVAIVATYWYKLEQGRSDNDLKRSMVERGMSVEEIERVLNAKVHEEK